MAEELSVKRIYRTYTTAQTDGSFFVPMTVPADYKAEHPDTEKAIPDELKNKLPFYDWTKPDNGAWIDVSDDALKVIMSNLQKQNAALGLKLAEAKKENILSQQERDNLKSAIASLGLKLAAAIKGASTEEVAK